MKTAVETLSQPLAVTPINVTPLHRLESFLLAHEELRAKRVHRIIPRPKRDAVFGEGGEDVVSGGHSRTSA